MEAKVVLEFEEFNVGDLLEVREEAVFSKDCGRWICDLRSTFFEENLVLIEQGE